MISGQTYKRANTSLLLGMTFFTISCSDAKFFGKPDINYGFVNSSPGNAPSYEQFPVVITAIKRKPIYTLIIADNSSSMNEKIDPMREGLSKLPATLFLPEDRVGIQRMNLLKEDFSDLHPIHSFYPGMKFEPGTVSLVSESSMKKFRDLKLPNSEKYPLEGPESGWFHPKAVHDKGHSFMTAALQNPYHGTTLEAGIFALNQMLMLWKRENKNESLTANHGLNVIFISDEIHPGCQTIKKPEEKIKLCEELIKQCPDLKELTKSFTNAGVKTFKFHGAIPSNDQGRCSYRELIESTKGKAITISKDPKIYEQFFDAVHSEPPGDFVTMKIKTIRKITYEIEVTADNKPITDFKIIDEHNLEAEVPKNAKEVRVTFPSA
jgi:hypothetical protein